jgi:predicted PurR-regulated permease PerM
MQPHIPTPEIEPAVKLPFYARLSFILISISLIILLLALGRALLIPLAFSLLIAFMLLPATQWLERKKIPRSVAALLAILLFLVFVSGLALLLGAQIADFAQDLPQLGLRMQSWIAQLQEWIAERFHVNTSRQLDYLTKGATDVARFATTTVQFVLFAISDFAIWTVFVFIFSYFMLTHRSLLRPFIIALFRRQHQSQALEVLAETRLLANGYVSGLVIEMGIVAVVNVAVFLLFGVKYALLLGILAAVLNIIPYLGIYTATAISAVITLSNSTPGQALTVVLILLIIHFLDANILMPRIVGGRVKMNPLTTLVAVILGSLMWGLAGMFLFIPLAGILKIIFERVSGLEPWAILMGPAEPTKKITKAEKMSSVKP